ISIPAPHSALFLYTTLFRSQARPRRGGLRRRREEPARRGGVHVPGDRADAEEEWMSALDELHDAITRKDAAAATRALDADPGLATARTASGQTPALVALYGLAQRRRQRAAARGGGGRRRRDADGQADRRGRAGESSPEQWLHGAARSGGHRQRRRRAPAAGLRRAAGRAQHRGPDAGRSGAR